MAARKRTFENRLETALTTLGRISRDINRSDRDDQESTVEDFTEKSGEWRPWDREQLMERAGTFRSLYWFGKPRSISAMECARRGWRCCGQDTLECSLCGAKLVFATPEAAVAVVGGEKFMAPAIESFVAKLTSEHRASCKWQGQVCPENLNSLPVISDSEIKKIFKDRTNALMSLVRLPVLTARWIEENVDEDVRRHLMELLDSGLIGFEGHSSQYPRMNPTAMRTVRLIAIAGWDLTLLDYRIKDKGKQTASLPRDPDNPPAKSPRIEIEVARDEGGEKGGVLRCKYCTAIVPLWSFEDRPHTQPTTQPLPSSPASLRQKVLQCTYYVYRRPTKPSGCSGNNCPATTQGLSQNRSISPLKTVPGPFGNAGTEPCSPASLSLASSIAGGPIFSQDLLTPEQLVWPSAKNFSPRSQCAEPMNAFPEKKDLTSNNSQADSALRSLLTGLPFEAENDDDKMPSEIDQKVFDPFRSHRDFCCWVSGNKSSGWARTLRALLPSKAYKFKSSPSTQNQERMTPEALVKTFLPISPA